ncbi:MAG: hypothetical protein QOH10_452, partial [Actinomycetota bacterium]|nr:hypothetical protein [Actinomycetota bacterium]
AAVAVAFAAVGASHRGSTRPAGTGLTTTVAPPTTIGPGSRTVVPDVVGRNWSVAVSRLERLGFHATKTSTTECVADPGLVVDERPAPGTHVVAASTVAIQVCAHLAPGATTTLPVVVCDTSEGTSALPSERAPTSVKVPAPPPFDAPKLSGYSDSHGRLPITGPAGWSCKALDATDGGVAIGITPPGVSPRDSWGVGGKPESDGVFALSGGACQGCIYTEVCAIVPGADADFPDFARSGLCTAPPAGQQVTAMAGNLYAIDDPAGTLGPDGAHSVLVYRPRTATTDASVLRETCILPAAQRAVCDTLFDEFLALHR